jgi:PAS domain S-box-containing protein
MTKIQLSSILNSKTLSSYADSLKASNLRYDTLVEQMAQGIFAIDKAGIIEFVNPAFANMLGYDREELVGKSIFDLIHKDSIIFFKRLLKSSKSVVEKKFEVTMLDRKKRDIYTIVIHQFLIDDENNYVGNFIIATDITMQKMNEQKIIKLNRDLAQRISQLGEINKELEAFSYSVSHDLRAPLRHISGYIDLLTTRFQDALPEKGRHYLDSISDSAKQMGSLIDDLLTFSRTGRNEVKYSNFNMKELLEEVILLFNHEYQDRTIEWKISDLPNVKSDYTMIKLVWMNLISNAIKFTKYKELAVIEIGCEQSLKHLQFYVKDNGVGFDMKYAQNLFGVFQRMHPVSQFEGTGIGLANVRRIIAKHGGETWAESQVEKGTTIFFKLPL